MKRLLFACLAGFAGLAVYAQNVAQRLDSLFTAPGNYESLNGSVLIADNGKIVYSRSFGYADKEKKKSNNINTVFNIGSVTKTFTSTAILQLLEKKKLGLDDPFQKYFPSFPYSGITIRHLLSHSSGLTDLETYFRVLDSLPTKMFTDQDIIPCIIHLHRPLKFTPGESFEYCNINFELLALLIEHLTNTSYPIYIRQHIFIPAGMKNSYFKITSPAEDSNRAVNYMYDNLYAANFTASDSAKNFRIRQILHNFQGLMGDGNIMSTLEDLLLFDQTLNSGKLLHPQTLALAFHPHVLNNEKDYNFFNDLKLGKKQYGLGWIIELDTSFGKIVSHGGHYPGIWTSFTLNLSKHQTIIIYDNNDWSGSDLLSEMAMGILNHRPIVNVLSRKMLARVYGQTLFKDGVDAAFTKLMELKDDSTHYMLRERDMNTLGYQFMLDGHDALSLETFKINALLFSTSSNAYDSYADALANDKKKEQAIAMYKKSLALNPANKESLEKLQKLLDKK